MGYVQLDDQVGRHPKVLKAGHEAAWFWTCGIAYCNSQLTDGFIPAGALATLGGFRNPRALAERCVAAAVKPGGAGLMERRDGGYVIHDYLEHNPTAGVVRQRRADADARRTRYKVRIAGHVQSASSDASEDASEYASSDASSDASKASADASDDASATRTSRARPRGRTPTPTPTSTTPHSPPAAQGGTLTRRERKALNRALGPPEAAWRALCREHHHRPACGTPSQCLIRQAREAFAAGAEEPTTP